MAVSIFTTTNYTSAIRYAAIRSLSGNIKETTKSDDTINDIASRKDQQVFTKTDTTSSDWDDTVEDTPLVIDASNHLVAAEILKSFGTIQNDLVAKDLIDRANELIAQINGNSQSGTIPDVQVTSGFNSTTTNGTFN